MTACSVNRFDFCSVNSENEQKYTLVESPSDGFSDGSSTLPASTTKTVFYRQIKDGFLNEAHLRCVKNEAWLRPMKRAYGTWMGSVRFASYERSECLMARSAASCLRIKCFIYMVSFSSI